LARVIAVAQQKGGAGKTTLAAHLTVAWALAGRSVALVDIDPQGSLTRWMRERETSGAAALAFSTVSGWRTQTEVERLARGHDLVVIDSPPHAETEARVAVRAADLVLVPLQPSPLDHWATAPTFQLAQAERRPVLVALNRVPARGKVVDAVIETLAREAVPVAAARLGSRQAFAAAMLQGLTALETEPRGKAAMETLALAKEVTARLEG